MIGRYVGRARGRALRAAGVPRTPNLPSGRALVRRELRSVARAPRVTGRRRAGHPADVTAADNPAVRSSGAPDASGNPYDDPSRDVGEGPDQFTPAQSLLLLVGVIIAVLLLSATCGTGNPVPYDPSDHCHITCEENNR